MRHAPGVPPGQLCYYFCVAPRSERTSILLVALGASLWGTDVVLRQPLTHTLRAGTIVFLEHAILTAVLLPVLVQTRHLWREMRGRQWAALATVAWGGSAVATLCFTQAVKIGSPTSAVLLQKVQPLVAALLARAWLGERADRIYWLLLAVAMAGAYLISFGDGPWLAPFSVERSAAAAFALAAALLWAASTVCGRYLSAALPFSALTAMRIALALPLLALFELFSGNLRGLRAGHALPLLWLALVPGLAALLLYYRGLRGATASRAAIAELCFPATAVLLSWLVLGSRLAPLQALGFVLLWAAVLRLHSTAGVVSSGTSAASGA